jgi:hypothetical protein
LLVDVLVRRLVFDVVLRMKCFTAIMIERSHAGQ